jgi:Kef-type K+ transport system membrane component KefB
MQKKIGKLIVFAVIFLLIFREIISLYAQKSEYFDDWRLPYAVILALVVVLAFLEVKSAVLATIFNLIAGIYLFEDFEKKVLFAAILSGIVTFYENISELKPLGYRKHGLK